MEYIGGLIVCYLVWFLISKLWKNGDEEEEYLPYSDVNAHLYDQAVAQIEKEKETEVMENEKKGARDLLLETLMKIGCQYKVGEEEDDNRIYFAYQGEHFFVNASNDAWYIQIFDTNWGHVELYDIDEFARLKKAINESNLANAVMTVYTIDETGSNVYVHCKSTILFVPQIPHIEAYLKTELDAFFHAHHSVGNEMARLRGNEKI